ncbi:Hypothetical protein MVR_LOCUS84 [uncultured virus]|nr:Hypothetical protein MVR_LOCUS84 [uncultured virus]
MIEFRGIWNYKGTPHEISIYLDPDCTDADSYATQVRVDDAQILIADVDSETIVLNGIIYTYNIREHPDELLVCGKELDWTCLSCFSWLCWWRPTRPAFFVVTNKIMSA